MVRRTPARALLNEPATVLAVWYQAKAHATDFSPPCSASRAFADGSRSDLEIPCAPRIAKSSHGVMANPKASDTRLRALIATRYIRFRPNRSAAQPTRGLNPRATALLRAARTPTSVRLRPRCRAYRGRLKLIKPKLSRESNPSAMIAISGTPSRRFIARAQFRFSHAGHSAVCRMRRSPVNRQPPALHSRLSELHDAV